MGTVLIKYDSSTGSLSVVDPIKAERRSGKLVYPAPLFWAQVKPGEYLVETSNNKAFVGLVVKTKKGTKLLVHTQMYTIWEGTGNSRNDFPGYTFYELAPKKITHRRMKTWK